MEKPASPPTESPLIELAQVEVASARNYDVVRVDRVDWRIGAGEFWIVGGARSVGKTDLIGTAAALQRPRNGSVRFFGKETANLHELEILEHRLRIGFVFKTGGRMISHLTVLENVSLPLRYHNVDRSGAEGLVENILKATGLLPFIHNTAGMLAAHLQQRVGLARALALQPRVLFLDEPLFGLGARERNWWLDFLPGLFSNANWLNRPQTLVVTTTNWNPWQALGDRFALVKKNDWRVLGGRAELETSAADLSDETSE